eukprot:gene29780-5243_t
MPADASKPGSGSQGPSKRKRTEKDAPVKPSRRSASEVAAIVANDAPLRVGFRNEIAKIYQQYSALLSGSDSGNDAAAFEGLLEAAKGNCGARRLAARLVPRFLHRFPQQVVPAADLLLSLHQDKYANKLDVDTIVNSTHTDALKGLADVLQAATKLADKAVPTVLRIVDYVLR